MRRPALLWGLAAAAVYLAAAGATVAFDLLPARPLYDGLAPPQPYRWVDPPPDLAPDNIPPEPAEATINFTEEGSEARSIATPEGQAIVIFQQGAIPRKEGAESVRVVLQPLDPDRAPLPPEGLELQGNVYRVRATYQPSGEPAEITEEISVVLRYPVHATVMLRSQGEDWEKLPTDVATGSLQLFADSGQLGMFVAAGPPQGGWTWQPYAIAGAGVAAAAAGYLFGRRRGARPETRQQRRAKSRRGKRE